jgi:hypothetical protein
VIQLAQLVRGKGVIGITTILFTLTMGISFATGVAIKRLLQVTTHLKALQATIMKRMIDWIA